MDRALKERIIGAIVLVVFIVLVVPVFLDGPAEEPGLVTESVTLPGQNGQERKRQTIVLERDREEPVPVAGPPATSESPAEEDDDAPPAAASTPRPLAAEAVAEKSPEPVAEEPPGPPREAQSAAAQATPPAQPEPEPESEDEPAGTPAAQQSATGMWAVQLGSFSNKANAERLAAELRGQGYAAFLSQLRRNGRELHRVRIGPQKDRASAESVAGKLSSDGHKGQVVPHP